MNAINRTLDRVGLVLSSTLTVVATGCTSSHMHTRTVYVPAPPPPARVVYVAPPVQPATAVVAVAPQPVAASVTVTASPALTPAVVIRAESDFYEPLTAFGRWEVVAGYGRCWIPARVELGWRPYCDGYWRRTDVGWYWMSNEPWGWATYHYGRWDYHATFGWFWVPHTQWAPAWVCWREGGGYVGWAPLRPSFTIGVNIHLGDYEPAHASRAYVFVPQRRMLDPVRPATVIVNNTTLINQTVNITKIKVENTTVINEGPRVDVVERETGRKVHSVAVREVRHEEEKSVAARGRNLPRGPENRFQSPAPAKTGTAPAVERSPITEATRPARTAHAPAGKVVTENPPKSEPGREIAPNIGTQVRPAATVPRPEVRNPAEPKPADVNPNHAVSRRLTPPVAERKATLPPEVTPSTRTQARHIPAPEKAAAATPAATAPRGGNEASRGVPVVAPAPAVRVDAASRGAAKQPSVAPPGQRGKRPSGASDAKPNTNARPADAKPTKEGKDRQPAEPTPRVSADEPSRN